MIKEWLASYNPANKDDATQALREIMQEVALAGLYRKGFCPVVCAHNPCFGPMAGVFTGLLY